MKILGNSDMTSKIWILLIGIACMLPFDSFADESKVSTTVTELLADFDPCKIPLDAKVVRQWEKDGIVYRYVTFYVGTFKEKPAHITAF